MRGVSVVLGGLRIVDGVHREVSQVIQQRFSEGIASSGRDVHMLVTIELEYLRTCVCELLIKGNARENFEKILSRVLATLLNTKIRFRIQ